MPKEKAQKIRDFLKERKIKAGVRLVKGIIKIIFDYNVPGLFIFIAIRRIAGKTETQFWYVIN